MLGTARAWPGVWPFIAHLERAREMGRLEQEYMRRGFQPAQRVAKALRVHRRLAGMAVE